MRNAKRVNHREGTPRAVRPKILHLSLNGLAFQTSFGWAGAAVTDKGLRYLFLHEPSQKRVESKLEEAGAVLLREPTPLLKKISSSVKIYFEGGTAEMDFPLDLSDFSEFSRKVITATRNIGYGQTRTYGQVAALAGSPKASRAVGAVMAGNPVPLVVP